MTLHDEFRTIFGPHWVKEISEGWSVNPRNVRRWAAGTATLPDNVASQMMTFAENRCDEINAARISILRKVNRAP